MNSQKLLSILGPDLTKECGRFREDLKEARQLKGMEQKEKFERLWHRKEYSDKNFDKNGHS